MVKNITMDITNMQNYIQFRKKCAANFITIARNYSLPLTYKYKISGMNTQLNLQAMEFFRIPINLIEDSMNGDYHINAHELARRMYHKCRYTSISRYRTLLYKLFTIFPEGIIIKKEINLCGCCENVILWKPEWSTESIEDSLEPIKKTKKKSIKKKRQ